VKRKKSSTVLIAVMLAVTLMTGMAAPLASATPAPVTIEFLNPLGKIDMLDNLPLAERKPWALDPVTGKLTERIVLALPTNGTQQAQIAIAMHLIDRFGKYDPETNAGIVLVTSSIGGNLGPNADVSYDVMSNSPDGMAVGGIGWPPASETAGASQNMVTYFAAPVGVLPTQGAWNLAYSSHPNMNAAGIVTGTVNWAGDIDVQLAGTSV